MNDWSIKQPPQPGIHIQLLGGFAVSVDGVQIPEEQWKSRRARSLVKLLALAPGHHLHRDQVIDALWPDSDPVAAANNLHQTLFGTRRVLETAGGVSLMLDKGFVNLAAVQGQPLSVDVELFEAAAQAKDGLDPGVKQAALNYYQGDLLPDDLYEDWTVQRREELRRVHRQLLLDLAQAYEARQAYPQGIEVLQQLLVVDRSNEDAHEGLMRLYALRGQRQQALRQYQTLASVLQAELEVAPGPGVTELYKDIQSGRFPPAAVHSKPSPATPLDLSFSSEQKKTNNLPLPLTSFIGREKEFGEILDLLKNHRLVTLNGSGGTGKTRLALQVAAEITGRYPDGAWLVELAQLTNPAAVYQTIAAVFGLREQINRENSHLLIRFLHGKHLLLLLDNCEHLLDACAWLANELLQACPQLTLLVTSREALGIAGEIAYRVPSLSIPDPNHLPPPEELARFESMRLFAERAAAVLPGFQLSKHDHGAAARICYRLDGIPLAIELAAARVGVLSVEQIAARLDDRFRLLTGGSRTALPRQRTLRASIDWSYSLLSGAECALFQRLSIFSGGCTLETAEAVCGFNELEKDEVLERLSSLVNKSLIVADHQPKSATRYRMPETIRQYAQEKLADANSTSEVRERHLAYYLHLVEEIQPRLKSASAPALLDQLDTEAENIRSALDWAINQNNQEGFEQELRLFIGLWQYWSSRGLYDEGREWGTRGLAGIIARDPRSIEIRARACFHTGWLQYQYSCHQLAWVTYLEESAALYRQTSNRKGLAMTLAFFRWALFFGRLNLPPNQVLNCINTQPMGEESLAIVDAIPQTALAEDLWVKARVLLWIGEVVDSEWLPEAQIPKIEEATVLFRELLDPEGEIQGITTLGNIARFNNDYPAARSFYLRALDLARLIKSKNAQRDVLAGLGEVAIHLHDYVEMEGYFQQLQNITAETSGEFSNIWPQRMLAKAVLFQGDYARARGLILENLATTQRLNDPYGSISNLVSLAGVAALTGQAERAVRILACLDHQMEDFFKSWDDIDREERQWHLDSLRAQFTPPEFARLWEQGRAMFFEQALSEAQSAVV